MLRMRKIEASYARKTVQPLLLIWLPYPHFESSHYYVRVKSQCQYIFQYYPLSLSEQDQNEKSTMFLISCDLSYPKVDLCIHRKKVSLVSEKRCTENILNFAHVDYL